MAVLGILIVDDSGLFLEAARDRLEREGMRVVGVAATSAEALRRAEELRPEVVLVDVMLGGESGFELARQLAAHHQDSGPTVILISTYAAADFARPIADSPAAAFLPKQELSADAIRRIVDGHGPAGPAGSRTCSAVPRPGGLSTEIVPPSASTRSLRPMMPEPRPGSAPPMPSSRIDRMRALSSPCTRRSMTVAWACLAVLASASDAV